MGHAGAQASRRKRSPSIALLIPRASNPRDDREALALEYLYERTLYSGEFQKGFWISIHASLWEQVLGRDYTKTLAALSKRGVIDINPRYSKGRFPKSYRLSDAFRRHRTEPYELLQNRQLRSSVRLDADDRIGIALAEMFHSIQISTESGIRGWNQQIVHRIRSGRFYATRCEYGRFHSSFTGLSREVRQRLTTIDGEPLIEIDVSCCQPLLVGVMATQQPESDSLGVDLSQTALPIVPLGQPQGNHNTTPPVPYSICSALSANLMEYLRLCQSGQLYDRLTELCAGKTIADFIPHDKWHPFAKDRKIQRRDTKQAFLVMLFADVPTMQRLPMYQIMQDHFPDVAAFLVRAKQECYQDLARNSQRLESQLMVDGAAAELVHRHPDAVFVTIHDAILIPRRFIDVAADCIREQFERSGVQPHLKFGL